MKNTILATVLVLATTAASAQVTVSGKIGEYIDNTKTGSTTVNSMVAEPTSNIKFSASETLDAGLTASVVVDTRLFANDPRSASTQLGDRQSTVGLSNKFGSVELGRNTHGVWNTIASTDVFSAFYGTTVEDIHNAQGKRFSNATFITVTPLKNVNGSYARDTVTEATTYSVGGSFGPVTATYARYELGTTKSDVFGAKGELLGTRLGLLYSTDTVAGVTTTGTSIGAAYKTASPVTLKATYGTRTGGTGTVNAYNVGAEYAFSKRTLAQVVYRNVNKPGINADIKEYGIGMVHSF
jgi:predicted porin